MFSAWRRLFRLDTGRSTADGDADQELALHLDLAAQELIQQGMTPEAAREEARRRFGDLASVRRRLARIDHAGERGRRRAEWWDALGQDLRFAVRTLRRQPGFALAAVLTLGFGIGATTAILSVVDGVLLRPLPYPNGGRAVLVWIANREVGPSRQLPFSAANFVDFRARTETLAPVAAFRSWGYTLLSPDGEAEQLAGARSSAGLFEALGVRPRLGRAFERGDELPNAEPVAILGDGLWRRRFGADPAIVGQPITLSGQRFTVVGVMPPGFHFPRGAELPAASGFGARTEVWTPLVLAPGELQFRGTLNLTVLGLPKPGLGRAAVDADLAAVFQQLEKQYPDFNTNLTAQASPLLETAVAGVRGALLVLLGAVGFLLLIACVNVSNLLVTRAAARHRELAIRRALGAGRGRLFRQLVTENLMLALAGGVLGVLVAAAGKGGLLALAPAALPRTDDVAVDWRVLSAVAALVLLVGIVFGGIVSAEVGSAGPVDRLREGARDSGGRSGRRLRSAMVVLEVATSLLLLAGAGVLGRTFLNLRRVEPGLSADGVLTARVSLPLLTSDFTQFGRLAPGWARFHGTLTEQLARQPGIRHVGVTTSLPLSGRWENSGFAIVGRPPPEPGRWLSALFAGVSDGYFEAVGMRLVRGRFFGPSDREPGQAGMIINEAMARRYWPGEDPIGARVISLFGEDGVEVVGVVADIRQRALATPPEPVMYFPLARYPSPSMILVVAGDPAHDPRALLPAVRETLRAVDPGVPLTEVRTMREVLAESLAEERFSATLLGGFALAALGLAVVGLYGVISFGVARRSREIGIRLALGAEPGRVLALVLREGLGLSLLGVVIGLVGAVALGRVLAGLVYDVSPTDPVTLAAVALLLIGVAVAASAVPARRAMRLDPLRALRDD